MDNKDNAAKAEREIKSVKEYIRKVLKEAGLSDNTLGYQIEMVASSIVVYRKIRKAFLDADTVTVKEISREGDERLKPHPLLFDLREQTKIVQDGLDKLMMNIKSKKKKAEAEDTLSKFMSEMRDDD